MSRVKIRASKCGFGESYDRMVRDRFICGLKSEKMRAYLISDEKITTAALVLQKASSRENSYNYAHHMNTVNAVKFKRTLYAKTVPNNRHSSYSGSQAPHSSSSLVCSTCTLKGHHANDCKVKCRFCRKMCVEGDSEW